MHTLELGPHDPAPTPHPIPTEAGQLMQLHIAGGNLVTKAPFRLDPLTGQWCVNAFVDAPQVRARDCAPARPRRWARCLRGRVR